ncbi:MAG: acetyl-CoA C-acetyltransferase [Gammaproteobacteria bacterium]|nr:acetyl-CoA C-acetyltransferase [Gammaproteobacteria bacterium]
MTHTLTNSMSPVYVIDGQRTPQLKSQGKPGPFSASDLAVASARSLLIKMPFTADIIDEVIIGCVMPDASEANIARQIALRIGCDQKVSAWTVQRNCASGLQAIDSGMNSIRSGQSDIVLVGGTEVMSRAPVMWNNRMVNWLSNWFRIRANNLIDNIKYITHLMHLRPSFFKPTFALIKGLNDPLIDRSMGQTAENLAWRFNISRVEMDQYALQSHMRLSQAMEKNLFNSEITPLYDNSNHFFSNDDGVRKDSSIDKLSKLKPVFDRKNGSVTAGNSAQVSDGATMLFLASEKAVKQHNLKVLGKLVECHWVGLAPDEMGLGPAHAIPPLLKNNDLKIHDIDYWEINEAFAAQVIACKKALNDETYCINKLDLNEKLGNIPDNRLNIDGGGISLGHPVGASGARIVLHLLKTLKRHSLRKTENLETSRGIASLCIGGGQGGAILLETALNNNRHTSSII